jgi:hypothetical protein
MALGQIRTLSDPSIPEIKDKLGDFKDGTKAAVHAFKSSRGIQRTGRPLDDVVGRMTITALDNEISDLEGTKPGPPAPTTLFQDVVVQITGFGGPNSPHQGQQQGSRLLRQDVSSPSYNLKTNRKLETIAFTGGESPNPVQTIAQLVRGAILSSGAVPGIVCLFGGSAGGKNVLQLASELSIGVFPVPLFYVGVSDGAFFDADAVDGPNFSGTNLKIAVRRPFSALEKANFFQSAGNDTKFSFSGTRRIWFGKMPNGEVHGPIQGFLQNFDLTVSGRVVPQGPNTNFESLHSDAVSIGDRAHLSRIRDILAAAR